MSIEDAAKAAVDGATILPFRSPQMYWPAPDPLGPIQTLVLNMLRAKAAELFVDLPDDPFDMSEWMSVLSPEARNALEAICSR